MRLVVVTVTICLGLSGCGVGYRIDPAILLLSDTDGLSLSELRGAAGQFLEGQGFEDFGRDEEMIALLERAQASGATTNSIAARLSSQYTYLNSKRNLRVIITDFTNPIDGQPNFAYSPPVGPFFEISVFEERPGGFSAAGNQFLATLQQDLEQTLAIPAIVAIPPPETNDAEYWRVTVTNIIGGILNWLLVFGISVATTGALSSAALKRIRIGTNAKRSVFVLVNTWLATPLPFPAATILVIFLPNLFAMPWTDADYYQRVQDVAFVSFPVAFALCILISLKKFRQPKHERDAA